METKKASIYKVDICLNPYYNGRYSWKLQTCRSGWILPVLILIIMEDTHGDNPPRWWLWAIGLNPYYNGRYSWSASDAWIASRGKSLNPYYNGRYSWRRQQPSLLSSRHWLGLNPYYNGRYSWSNITLISLKRLTVLILIIMEDTHGDSLLRK